MVVFATTLTQAVRHPRRSTVDPALLFGASLLVIGTSVGEQMAPPHAELLADLNASASMLLPYLLLRLAEDFAQVPRWLPRVAELALGLSVGVLFVVERRPSWLTALLLSYFIVASLFATAAFVREAGRSRGVTQRRLIAVAVGAGFLGLNLLFMATREVQPGLAGFWTSLIAVAGLGAGMSCYLGFGTPRWLRQAWQAPELHVFLTRIASLPRLPDVQDILREIEVGATLSLGAQGARIGLWDEQNQMLLYHPDYAPLQDEPGEPTALGFVAFQSDKLVAGRAVATQKPVFASEVAQPLESEPDQRQASARNLLAAPITAGEVRIGALTVHSRASVFAEDDLELLALLAGQAAVVLESRRLIDEAATLQAHEEATRLKDDFLSAAAHDLRSPLTSILGQAQRLQRQARRSAEIDAHGLDVIVDQTDRLRRLVSELLDATRVESGAVTGSRQDVDLAEILRDVCSQPMGDLHRCTLAAPEAIPAKLDAVRIRQLFDNLVENALKYSPAGGEVAVRAEQGLSSVDVTITDRGIGIAPDDLTHVFDRFRRGSNVDDRRFPGMGLGLYICRGIVEEHRGRIWATSSQAEGTTVHVWLPLDQEAE